MSVRIGFVAEGEAGGPSIFLSRLRRELEKRNAFSVENCDIYITTGGRTEFKKIQQLHKDGKSVVYRVDGCYFELHTLNEFAAYLNRKLSLNLGSINRKSIESTFNRLFTPQLTRTINRFENLYIRNTLEIADFVVYQSEFSLESIGTFIGNYEGGVVFNGVDLDEFSPKGERFHFPNTINIISSGKFRPHKRLQDAIRVIAHLVGLKEDVFFHILGTVDRFTTTIIEQLIEKHHLQDRVKLYGRVSPKNLPKFYRSCDVMLHPSWLDACPNVVVESLASGIPVVCPSTGGTPELVQDAGKIIIENHIPGYKELYNFEAIPKIDVITYTEAILEIMDTCEKFSQLARQRAIEDLDIKIVCDKYLHSCRKAFRS